MVLYTPLLASDDLWLTTIPCDRFQHTCTQLHTCRCHYHLIPPAVSAQRRDFVRSVPRGPLSALLHFRLRQSFASEALKLYAQNCGSALHNMQHISTCLHIQPFNGQRPCQKGWVLVNTCALLLHRCSRQCRLERCNHTEGMSAGVICLRLKALSHLSQISEVLQQPQVATRLCSQCLHENSSRSVCFASIFAQDIRGWRLGLHCATGGS